MSLLFTVALALAAPSTSLLLEDFAGPGSLKGWTIVEGARTGDGGASAATIEGAALLLEGNQATRRWIAAERTIDLGGAPWVRVAARMRSENVDSSRAQYKNADLFVRFQGGPVQALRVLIGTQPWLTVARRYAVPTGATSITVGCFLSMPGRLWVDDIVVESISPPAFKETRSEHFTYRLLDNVRHDESHTGFNEESYRQVSAFFGVQRRNPIAFVQYPDLKSKEEYTGTIGNAVTLGDEIHTIWPTDRHEIVHILGRAWGDPPALVAEGLAVHLSGNWQGRSVADAANEVALRGKWVPLATLMDTEAFRLGDDIATYAIAGAFVGWVIKHSGVTKLRELYRKLSVRSPVRENLQVLSAVLGQRIEEVDRDLRAELQGRGSPH